MRNADSLAAQVADRPILPWTFVAGAFVHFVIPVYLAAVVLACLLGAPSHPSASNLLAIALPFSARFLVGYAVLTGLASLGAAMVDPLLRARRTRREAIVPSVRAAASARRCTVAIRRARGLLGDDARRPLDAIDAAYWDHRDPRYQAIESDLVKVIDAAATAMASAHRDGRAAIAATTTAAIVNIAAALEALGDEQRTLDEGDVETLSRYVQIRYGPSDFAGGPDR